MGLQIATVVGAIAGGYHAFRNTPPDATPESGFGNAVVGALAGAIGGFVAAAAAITIVGALGAAGVALGTAVTLAIGVALVAYLVLVAINLAGGNDFRTAALTAAVAVSGAFLGTVAALGGLIAVLYEVAMNVFVGESGTKLSANNR